MLKEKIDNKFKEERLNKGELKSALMSIVSKIKNKEIELRKELDDSEIIKILIKEKKELNETIDAAIKLNRQEIIDYNNKVIDYIDSILPEQLSEDDIIEILKTRNIDKSQNRGLVIKDLIKEYKSVDGKTISNAVNKYFSS